MTHEVVITTNKHNHLIDPALSIWGWEVPVYLFLGGLAAGILIVSTVAILLQRKDLSYVNNKLVLWGPIFLSAGMGALFLDLEYKAHVFRFYTSFQVTSPMSWGSWLLILYYPISMLLAVARLKQGYPRIYNRVKGLLPVDAMAGWVNRNQQGVAWAGMVTGVALGIYTGILLSAYVARPFWNSSILGVLFLCSGVSTALAFVALMAKDQAEKKQFVKWDFLALILELSLIVLFLIGMSTDSQIKLDSLKYIMGGDYTLYFWVFFVSLGLVVPLLLEIFELKGKRVPYFLAPLLVLYGGLVFRFLMVEIGQHSTWIPY